MMMRLPILVSAERLET